MGFNGKRENGLPRKRTGKGAKRKLYKVVDVKLVSRSLRDHSTHFVRSRSLRDHSRSLRRPPSSLTHPSLRPLLIAHPLSRAIRTQAVGASFAVVSAGRLAMVLSALAAVPLCDCVGVRGVHHDDQLFHCGCGGSGRLK